MSYGEGMNIDNIFDGDNIEELFKEDESPTPALPNREGEPNGVKEGKNGGDEGGKGDDTGNDKDNATEADLRVEDIFPDVKPEGVSSGEGKETDADEGEGGTSPDNFYSTIAAALKEDGIFPDLEDEKVQGAVDAQSFKELIESQIQAGLDERQKRIDEALSNGVQTDVVRGYENTLGFLNQITDAKIEDEGNEGETLRKQLIYQDYINRGYTKERALREVKKSFDAGSDVEDAKEALEGNKQYYQTGYDNIRKQAQQEAENDRQARKKMSEDLKKSIMEDKVVLGGMDVDRVMRQKAYDVIAKPIYTDPKTGEVLTEIQKYNKEHYTDFMKNVGLLYTLTDGFKNLDKLIGKQVRKEVNKGISALSQKLSNTSRNSDGSLRFVTKVKDDDDSYIGKGFKLDV